MAIASVPRHSARQSAVVRFWTDNAPIVIGLIRSGKRPRVPVCQQQRVRVTAYPRAREYTQYNAMRYTTGIAIVSGRASPDVED